MDKLLPLLIQGVIDELVAHPEQIQKLAGGIINWAVQEVEKLASKPAGA